MKPFVSCEHGQQQLSPAVRAARVSASPFTGCAGLGSIASSLQSHQRSSVLILQLAESSKPSNTLLEVQTCAPGFDTPPQAFQRHLLEICYACH